MVGIGCSAMSGSYGPADDEESIAVLHEAMQSGIEVRVPLSNFERSSICPTNLSNWLGSKSKRRLARLSC